MSTEAFEVRLRPVEDSDRSMIEAVEAEPAGNAMANVVPRSPEQAAAHWQRVMEDASIVSRIIQCSFEGKVEDVGFITSFKTEVEILGKAAERRCIGYRISESYWGRGIVSRALQLLLDELDERPLWAVTSGENRASQRVLLKCGFAEVDRRWTAATDRYPAGEEAFFRLG